jgi:hypothetical protein
MADNYLFMGIFFSTLIVLISGYKSMEGHYCDGVLLLSEGNFSLY